MVEIAVTEGFAPFEGHQTWYKVTGDLGWPKVPLVVVHGGPGCTHDYVDAFKDIARTGRAVVHYDQIGNGRSTHLRDAPKQFWCVDTFLAEMDALLAHLGIAGRYNLLGQSWGGMLSAEHAVRQPKGLNALVIANSPTSMRVWVEEANRLRRDLPEATQAALERYEASEDYGHPDYKAAAREFYRRHVCRVQPMPEEVQRTFDWIEYDPTVYHTMNGPTEFHVVGTMKDWTIVDRLDRVKAPTLVISGRHDEATPRAVEDYAKRIEGALWEVLEHSSHMPHVEEQDACLACVSNFLDAHEK